MTAPRAVLYGKTQLLALWHLPARGLTQLVERHGPRGGQRLLAEVRGHPTAAVTYEALAAALRKTAPELLRHLELLRLPEPRSKHSGGRPAA